MFNRIKPVEMHQFNPVLRKSQCRESQVLPFLLVWRAFSQETAMYDHVDRFGPVGLDNLSEL